MSTHKCNKRSNHLDVSEDTLRGLNILADLCGYKTLGKVVDKLVHEKMAELRETEFFEEDYDVQCERTSDTGVRDDCINDLKGNVRRT